MTYTRINSALLLIWLIMALNSCVNSNHVLSNSFIQKRKYNKGWFIKKTVEPKTNIAKQIENELIEHITVDPEGTVLSNSSDSNSHDLTKTTSNSKKIDQSNAEKVIVNSKDNKNSNLSFNEPNIKLFRKYPLRISYNANKESSINNEPKDLTKKRQEPFGLIGFIIGILTLIAIIIILGNALEIASLTIVTLTAGLISLTFGIISLIRIMRNKDTFKGKGVSIASIITGGVLVFFGGVLLFLWLAFTF